MNAKDEGDAAAALKRLTAALEAVSDRWSPKGTPPMTDQTRVDDETLERLRSDLTKPILREIGGTNNCVVCVSDQDLLALLSAYEALRAERKWRPIESAPKDGTRILCAAIGHSNKWSPHDGDIVEDPTLRVWWACTGSWSEKYQKFWDGVEPSGFANLSHWLPLPQPPGGER